LNLLTNVIPALDNNNQGQAAAGIQKFQLWISAQLLNDRNWGFYDAITSDGLVQTSKLLAAVIPAKAGIQLFQLFMDVGLIPV
jgi:hypothetical protein